MVTTVSCASNTPCKPADQRARSCAFRNSLVSKRKEWIMTGLRAAIGGTIRGSRSPQEVLCVGHQFNAD
eukprot:COSAG02_NODE_403_length_23058_cov_12.124134_7_plen_69_part_00